MWKKKLCAQQDHRLEYGYSTEFSLVLPVSHTSIFTEELVHVRGPITTLVSKH